jgi:glycosyltransferase involved in cell wall biosynthesis
VPRKLPDIIFVNRFFHPDLSATSQMLSDLAFALAARGHRVRVITSRLTYEGGEAALPARETIAGVDVVRVATTRFGRANLAGRALDYLTFYGAAVVALARHARRGSVVVVKTDPPVLAVVAAPIIRLKRARLVNWLQDVFPEVAVAFGMGGGAKGRLFALLGRLRDATLRAAQLNVVLGERMADLIRARGAAAGSIRTIPNWADGSLVAPVDAADNPLRREWGLEGCFVVGYSGNLGRAHDIETLCEAIRLIARRKGGEPDLDRIRWLFIGGGAGMSALRQRLGEPEMPDVVFRPYQPRDRLAESLSVPDVHLISLKPEMEGLIVPSKFYGIAAAGRASIFIGDTRGEIAALHARHCSGLSVAEGDAEALAEAVIALSREPERTLTMGEAARAAFLAEFDLPHAVACWEAALAELDQATQPANA